jgi:predicted NAD-dependent protein-ADP-ribosyltransferase YbiA (DUF1768 family)
MQLLPLMRVVVMPSVSEGLPLALLEAMSSGRAIVATEVGGIPMALAHGAAGLLAPPSDPSALADAIITLLTDDERSRAFGLVARQRYDAQFTARAMATAYAACTRQAATRPRERRRPAASVSRRFGAPREAAVAVGSPRRAPGPSGCGDDVAVSAAAAPPLVARSVGSAKASFVAWASPSTSPRATSHPVDSFTAWRTSPTSNPATGTHIHRFEHDHRHRLGARRQDQRSNAGISRRHSPEPTQRTRRCRQGFERMERLLPKRAVATSTSVQVTQAARYLDENVGSFSAQIARRPTAGRP